VAPSSLQRRSGSLPATMPSTPTSPNSGMDRGFDENSDGKLLPAFNFTPRASIPRAPNSFDSSLMSSQKSGSSPRNASSSSSSALNSSWPSSTIFDQPRTPPRSRAQSASTKSLLMLRREVDFVPMSPKKSQIVGLGVGTPVPARTPSNRNYKESELGKKTSSPRGEKENRAQLTNSFGGQVKTTEEKKELLGSMLGNVDALVEGVKKAGIWGLG
jgi:hypothetical protein